MDERQLVDRVLAGDEKAQREFFLAYRDRLYRTCVHFLGYQDTEAEDITQQAFLIAYDKLKREKFDFRCKLSTWLIQICINLCYERLRERKRMLYAVQEEMEALAGASPGSSDEEYAENEKATRLKLIHSLIDTLGEHCRQVIELRDIKGQSYIAISKFLKVPIGTVMSRLYRCRSLLKTRVMLSLPQEE
jgi:RNA polymerase sigma-70 factor (ECF subfamily)